MRKVPIKLQAARRALPGESIRELHARFLAGMQQLGPPLGLRRLEMPSAPEIPPRSGSRAAVKGLKYPIKRLTLHMMAVCRKELNPDEDSSRNDDEISIRFAVSNKAVDYQVVLYEHFPSVIQVYGAYRAKAVFDAHGTKYADADLNPAYPRLRANPSIDMDGRNNIHTLEPAMFWDAQLCHRALGYGPDEVMRRLDGHVVMMRPLFDGVYIVFNDDASLSFAAFVEMNRRFKRILGIE